MNGDVWADSLEDGTFELTLVAGLGKDELERRAALAHRGGEVCNRALAFYLHDMQQRRVHQELGFRSAAQFAMHRLGMSKGRARDLVATGRKLQELPCLDRAFAEGLISWSKVRRLARVATTATEQAWLARALEATHEEIDALVNGAQEGDPPRSLEKGLPEVRFVKRFVLDVVQHEMFERAREKLSAELGRPVTESELLDDLLRLFLGSDADGTVPGRKKVDGSFFHVAVRPPDVPATAAPEEDEPVLVAPSMAEALASDAAVHRRLRRRVLARDGGRCQSCGARRSPMMHHVQWRAHGGSTRADNLVTLCARCHALVHGELLFVSGSPRRWTFRDRHGRSLRAMLPVPGAQLRMCAAAHGGAAAGSERIDGRGAAEELRSPDAIPEQADADEWRAHEELEWAADGKTSLVRRGRGLSG